MSKGSNREGWPHFSVGELRCSHCGRMHMNEEFMDTLEGIREDYGKAMTVTSGYRCPEYNDEISSSGPNGPHTTGKAVDIAVYGHDAHELLFWALKHGISGIGLKQTGPHNKRFIHLDTIDESDTRPWVWTY